MSRIQLRIYRNPGEAEIFINLKRKDGGFNKEIAKVDTGAEVSLLPLEMMTIIEHQLIQQQPIRIEQAGIAQQNFQAFEGKVTLFLEDSIGNTTKELEVMVWFAQTQVILLGFEGASRPCYPAPRYASAARLS